MNHQSEAILENNLIKQLVQLGYSSTKVVDGAALVSIDQINGGSFDNCTPSNLLNIQINRIAESLDLPGRLF